MQMMGMGSGIKQGGDDTLKRRKEISDMVFNEIVNGGGNSKPAYPQGNPP
jgi:hypothetical protein